MPTEPMKKLLIQPNQQMKRPDLTTMSMAGQLQINPSSNSHTHLLGLMSQQQNRHIRRRISQGGSQIRPMPNQPGRPPSGIIDPSKNQLRTIT